MFDSLELEYGKIWESFNQDQKDFVCWQIGSMLNEYEEKAELAGPEIDRLRTENEELIEIGRKLMMDKKASNI